MLRVSVAAPTALDLRFYETMTTRNPSKLSVFPVPEEMVWDAQERTAPSSKDMTFRAYHRLPHGTNGVPDAIASRLARMLQDHLRLPVLTTAAACAAGRPRAGPLAFDRCYVQAGRLMHVNMPLHPSTCTCICGAHGLPHCKSGKTIVELTICGTAFKKDVRCPRCIEHEGLRHGVCGLHFSVDLRCVHRNEDKKSHSCTRNPADARAEHCRASGVSERAVHAGGLSAVKVQHVCESDQALR